MNLNLLYFTDEALAHLELAADRAVCKASPLDPWHMRHLTDFHRFVIEERMRREHAKAQETGHAR